MKKAFLIISPILILILIFNMGNLRSSNFVGKENIKDIFFYLKKKQM